MKTIPKRKRPKRTLTEPDMSEQTINEVTEYLDWLDQLPRQLRNSASKYSIVKKWRKNT